MTEVIDIPNELIEALSQNGHARTVFENLSPNHRNEYARWVSEAKRQETRVRRARKALEMLMQ